MRLRNIVRLTGLTGALFVMLSTLQLAAQDSTAATGPAGSGLLTSGMMGWMGDHHEGGADLLSTIDFGGSIDVAYTYNTQKSTNPGFVENPTRVNDVFHNEVTLHNVILNIGREANDEQMFGFGFMPTIGTDGQFTQGGLDFGAGAIDVRGGNDFDVLEAYGSVNYGAVTVKAGKFLSAAGSEVISSHENATFSRSFKFGNARPLTHTGVLAEITAVEREDGESLFDVSLGYTNGWDQVRSTNDAPTFITAAGLSPAEFFSVNVNWIYGWSDRGRVGANNSFSHLIDIVSRIAIPETGLSLLLGFDYYTDENEGGAAGTSNYYGLTGTLKLDFDNPLDSEDGDNMYVAFRGEFFDDADLFLGSITGPAGPVGGAITGSQLWDLTGTLGYWVTDATLFRFETRYDHANATIFDDGSRQHQVTFAVNTVFTF
jgi:hypothetical protein